MDIGPRWGWETSDIQRSCCVRPSPGDPEQLGRTSAVRSTPPWDTVLFKDWPHLPEDADDALPTISWDGAMKRLCAKVMRNISKALLCPRREAGRTRHLLSCIPTWHAESRATRNDSSRHFGAQVQRSSYD